MSFYRFLLGKIIETAMLIPNFEKTLILEHLPQIIELCTKLTLPEAFRCLILCFENFPSTCLPYKNKLEPHLLKYLDSKNKMEVMLAAKAFHFLQQVIFVVCRFRKKYKIVHSDRWSRCKRNNPHRQLVKQFQEILRNS